MTTFQIPEAKRKEEIRAGKLWEFAMISPFAYLDAYRTVPAEPTGVPVLDRVRKADGTVNYNNLRYVGIFRQYLAAAMRSLVRHPLAYLNGIVRALACLL